MAQWGILIVALTVATIAGLGLSRAAEIEPSKLAPYLVAAFVIGIVLMSIVE